MSAPIEALKAKPEHMANLVLGMSYGLSVFLHNQYLVLMTVAYLLVTVVGVGREVHEIHHYNK